MLLAKILRKRQSCLIVCSWVVMLMVCSAKKDRTLDVICMSPGDFEMWFWGIQIVKHYPPGSWSLHHGRGSDHDMSLFASKSTFKVWPGAV